MKKYIVEYGIPGYVSGANTVEDLDKYLNGEPHPEYNFISCQNTSGNFILIWQLNKIRKSEYNLKRLEKKLKIAVHALKIYGNMDFWKYRLFDDKEMDKVTRTKCTSLEVHPIKDGWEWADEALKEMDKV